MFHIMDKDQITVIPKRFKKLLVLLSDSNIQLKDWLLLRYCDKRANMLTDFTFNDLRDTYKQMVKILNTKPPFSVKDLAINGIDIMNMGIPQGKLIGNILNLLLEKVIAGEVENNREKLLDVTESLLHWG